MESDAVEVRYHRLVQSDVNSALEFYTNISEELADDLFGEFETGVARVRENPAHYHFDESGLRRYNLERFLYDTPRGQIRIWVFRHEKRNPRTGLKRFK